MTRLARAVADSTATVMLRRAEVVSVTDLSESFRIVDLTGDALRKASWEVGDKIQVRTDPGGGLSLRAYTPYMWDTTHGATKLFISTGGKGPGSAWARGLSAGKSCHIFGPRRSLKLLDLAGPILFVGDETSFALAAAWRRRSPHHELLSELFEVTDPGDCDLALQSLGLQSAQLVKRQDGHSHLDRLTALVVDALRTHPEASLCLTGRAQTIASIRRGLKASGSAGRSVRVKAYWDENRSALD